MIAPALCTGCEDVFDIECVRVCAPKAITCHEGIIIECDTTWRLRSEHLIWLIAIMGTRDGKQFPVGSVEWDGFRKLASALYKDPDLKVRLTKNFDDNCINCPVKQQPGHAEDMGRLDDICYQRLGIEPGTVMRLWDLIQLFEDTFSIKFIKELGSVSDKVLERVLRFISPDAKFFTNDTTDLAIQNEGMFCFQCEQAADGKGCTGQVGICGKNAKTARLQDKLTGALVSLARVAGGRAHKKVCKLIIDGLYVTLTNVSFDDESIRKRIKKVNKQVKKFGGSKRYDISALWNADDDIRSLKSLLLFGLRGMAAYAHHARVLGKSDPEVDTWFIKGMAALGNEHTVDEWLSLLMEFGGVNLKCMALLDGANTSSYGTPLPAEVGQCIEKGPFIVVSGHDLHDLHMLLDQTVGKGVNVYTHCEMLPAHGYPELKKYPQLKGNFGTAWYNQQKEFENIPAPILFTSNCLKPPGPAYADRVYTTSIMAYPGVKHINAYKDGYKNFSDIIQHAIKLGGFHEERQLTGINGGVAVTTGFGWQAVLDNAPAIIDAVKNGGIKHFFLVGGCDGSKAGRGYYTEFVKQTPADSVVLTLACGKFRFNDLDLGSIGPFPRILDMGQCNDAYGAVQVAIALAEAFGCGINDLPLTLVLSWYEQKAVCILLTLISLGIKNIYIGPSIPAFFSETVLNVLKEKFFLRHISTPEHDLRQILGLGGQVEKQ